MNVGLIVFCVLAGLALLGSTIAWYHNREKEPEVDPGEWYRHQMRHEKAGEDVTVSPHPLSLSRSTAGTILGRRSVVEYRNPPVQVVRTVQVERDDGFLDSVVVGAMTDSTIGGTLLGGNVLGAALGATLRDAYDRHETPAPTFEVDDTPSAPAPSFDNVESTAYTSSDDSSSSSSDSSSDDSSSSSSSDDS